MSDNACDYCRPGACGVLFRILDSYPHGEAFGWSGECEECDSFCQAQTCKRDDDDYERECEDCDFCECGTCDCAPYQPENALNLTIAVVGGKLMFEDKIKRPVETQKRYADINYCPMCGRKFKEESQ